MSEPHYPGLRPQPAWRESLKRSLPLLVHIRRFGRLLANQIRYPVAATVLDWNGMIIDGPFRGMRFARSGKGPFADVLGTYERCLHPIVEHVIETPPRLIIDVGAAYGYYALGFGFRCPESCVIAYEMDPTRASLMRKYRRRNGLEDRVEIRGLCTPESLKEDLRRTPDAFVLMDVEGAEDELLDPAFLESDQAEMVVELHEMFVPGVTQRLMARFQRTHHAELVKQHSGGSPPPHLPAGVRRYWRELSDEPHAHEMAWLHLRPRAAGGVRWEADMEPDRVFSVSRP